VASAAAITAPTANRGKYITLEELDADRMAGIRHSWLLEDDLLRLAPPGLDNDVRPLGTSLTHATSARKSLFKRLAAPPPAPPEKENRGGNDPQRNGLLPVHGTSIADLVSEAMVVIA
jgi:hypothetical protein